MQEQTWLDNENGWAGLAEGSDLMDGYEMLEWLEDMGRLLNWREDDASQTSKGRGGLTMTSMRRS